MSQTHRVVLRRGAHTISAEDEANVRAAIQAGTPVVDVWTPSTEGSPDYNKLHPTMLVTAHILMLAPIPPEPLAIATTKTPEPPWQGSGSYVVQLTKPTMTMVRADGAAAIRQALLAGKKIVSVDVELFPGAEERSRVSIVLAHVVAITEIPKPLREIVADAGPKVTALWGRRQHR
jgi:hypothetical protein